MLTKLPLDIPKFEAKPNEDPGDHVTTFHLWCSSNSLKDDSVQLRLFQRTLIGSVVKWYIELDRSRYSSFGKLAMAFLNHFQLPLRYDVGTELLAKFEKNKADHIYDHIREWRHQKSLIKDQVSPDFLLEWLSSMYHFATLPMRVRWNNHNCMESSFNELDENQRWKVVTWSHGSSLGLASNFGMSEGNFVDIGGQRGSWQIGSFNNLVKSGKWKVSRKGSLGCWW